MGSAASSPKVAAPAATPPSLPPKAKESTGEIKQSAPSKAKEDRAAREEGLKAVFQLRLQNAITAQQNEWFHEDRRRIGRILSGSKIFGAALAESFVTRGASDPADTNDEGDLALFNDFFDPLPTGQQYAQAVVMALFHRRKQTLTHEIAFTTGLFAHDHLTTSEISMPDASVYLTDESQFAVLTSFCNKRLGVAISKRLVTLTDNTVIVMLSCSWEQHVDMAHEERKSEVPPITDEPTAPPPEYDESASPTAVAEPSKPRSKVEPLRHVAFGLRLCVRFFRTDIKNDKTVAVVTPGNYLSPNASLASDRWLLSTTHHRIPMWMLPQTKTLTVTLMVNGIMAAVAEVNVQELTLVGYSLAYLSDATKKEGQRVTAYFDPKMYSGTELQEAKARNPFASVVVSMVRRTF